MKKLFLLLTVAVIFSLATSAQIKKGATFLGGQISFYNSNTDFNTAQSNQKNKYAYFNVSVGKALKENSVLGLYVSYGHNKVDNFYNGNTFGNSKLDRYNVGVFYRQYKRLAKDFYIFGELGGGYLGSNQTDADLNGNNKVKYTQSGGELYLTPGVSYRVYKKLQLELLIPQIAGIQYSVNKTTSLANNSKQDKFQFNTNLNASLLSSLGLGFRFIL